MARVLIADDDQALRDLAERALMSEGHDVDAVGDGGEALSRISSTTPPDILISDVDMPVLDGITLAKRALAQKPDLKILIISGMTDRLEGVGGLKSKAVATLLKPFSLEALKASVDALLAK